MRKTVPIKVRIDNRQLEWLRDSSFKINTAINIAVERWVYYEQHDKVAQYVIRDVTTRNSRLKYDRGATHTSVRLNEQLYEYIDMRGYVMARVIYNALRTLKEDCGNGTINDDTMWEMIRGNNGKRQSSVNCTHRKVAEPEEKSDKKSCLNCMYGICDHDGRTYCTRGIGGSRYVDLKYNAKCWINNGTYKER